MKKKIKAKKVIKKAVKKTVKKTQTSSPKKAASGPMTPLNDHVVIRPLSPEEMGTTTASGIIIPDTTKEEQQQGVVVAVGQGRYADGKRIPIDLEVGARVMFIKGYDTGIKIDGTKYYVIPEAAVLAVIH